MQRKFEAWWIAKVSLNMNTGAICNKRCQRLHLLLYDFMQCLKSSKSITSLTPLCMVIICLKAENEVSPWVLHFLAGTTSAFPSHYLTSTDQPHILLTIFLYGVLFQAISKLFCFVWYLLLTKQGFSFWSASRSVLGSTNHKKLGNGWCLNSKCDFILILSWIP
jgi:hypothetical protein